MNEKALLTSDIQSVLGHNLFWVEVKLEVVDEKHTVTRIECCLITTNSFSTACQKLLKCKSII